MAAATLDEVDDQLRLIINSLYVLIVQAHDYHCANTKQAMTAEIKSLLLHLQTLSTTSRRLPTHLPLEIIQYVENSRNPDIYTREFVELVMRYNQSLKGRSEGFARFRDVLAREMAGAMPELRGEVRRVVEASGGVLE